MEWGLAVSLEETARTRRREFVSPAYKSSVGDPLSAPTMMRSSGGGKVGDPCSVEQTVFLTVSHTGPDMGLPVLVYGGQLILRACVFLGV